MTRGPWVLSPRELAAQDEIVAILRDAGGPMTTIEVQHLAGPQLRTRKCEAFRHREGKGTLWELVECQGNGVDLVREHLAVDRLGHRLLERLESVGLVRRVVGRGGRMDVWIMVIRVPDRAVADLEERLALPWGES